MKRRLTADGIRLRPITSDRAPRPDPTRADKQAWVYSAFVLDEEPYEDLEVEVIEPALDPLCQQLLDRWPNGVAFFEPPPPDKGGYNSIAVVHSNIALRVTIERPWLKTDEPGSDPVLKIECLAEEWVAEPVLDA